jgi:hypothetical protein
MHWFFLFIPMGSRYDAAIGNDGVNLSVSSAFNQDFNMFWDARSVVNDKGWFFETEDSICTTSGSGKMKAGSGYRPV